MSDGGCKEEECVQQLQIKVEGLTSAVKRLVRREAIMTLPEREAFLSEVEKASKATESATNRIIRHIPIKE